MRLIRRLAWVALVMSGLLGGVAAAQGVPSRISFTGNLSNTTGPLTGQHAFVFSLYDSLTNTTGLVWTESYSGASGLVANQGLVFADLGSVTALTPTVFNGAQLYLDIAVDGTTMTPRLAIDSVPYAIRAGVANSAETLGTLFPGDVQRRVLGVCNGTNFMQGVMADGGVTCAAAPAGATYTNGAGLSLASNTFSVTTGGVSNAMLTNPSLTVSAGTGLTGGGSVALGGTTTLSVGTIGPGNGGTGLTAAPASVGQYLRSAAAGSWSIGTIAAIDLPSLSGSYVDLSSTQTIGGAKTFSSTVSANISGSAASFTGALGGDVTGGQSTTNVSGLQGRAVAATAPAAGQGLAWNGASWAPLSPPNYSSTFIQNQNAATQAANFSIGGNAKAGSFSYGGTMTGYASFSARAFQPDPTQAANWRWESSGYNYGYVTKAGCTDAARCLVTLYAPVNLPNNATVTLLECSVWDQSAGSSIRLTANLNRDYTSLYVTSVGTIPATLSTGVPTSHQVMASAALTHVVDNSVPYDFRVDFESGSGDTQLVFEGCRITYTYTTVEH